MENSDSTSAIKPKFMMRHFIKSLGPRMKRLVYISSLADIVRNNKELDSEILDKMNSVLNLANSEITSLKFPAFMSDKIWTDTSVIEEDIKYLKHHKVTTNSCFDRIKNIVNKTPNWFKYDDDAKIQADIINLFCLDKEDFVAQ